MLARLAPESAPDLDAEVEQCRRHGGTPLAQLPERCRATVCGCLRSVTVRPRQTSCQLEAELFDGTGTLRLVWVGRESITGIEPGRRLRARGTVSSRDGARVMYNPSYEMISEDQ